MKENKINPINWNAGGQYNDIIKELKQAYMIAMLDEDYQKQIEILDTDLDISNSKILQEVSKNKQDMKKTKERITNIRTDIENTRQHIENKKEYANYQLTTKTKIAQIRRKIYDLQGIYGILYPHENNEDKTNIPTAYINQR